MIAAELIEKCFARIQRAAGGVDEGGDIADARFAVESAITVAIRSLLLTGGGYPEAALAQLTGMLQATVASRGVAGQQVIHFSLDYLHGDRVRQVSLV